MTVDGVGGKIVDASAFAALLRRRISAVTWWEIAGVLGLVLYLPTLAVSEVHAVRPDAAPAIADLLNEPMVVVADLTIAASGAVDRLLDSVRMFDALAGQVVHTARERGWPVMTDDPGRIHRIDPALEVDLL